MSKLVLYGSQVSTCTNSVKAFFRAAKIDYEFKNVNIFTGENKTEEYLKLNPLGKVPVLVDNGFTLRESMVFSRYIANSREVADHWYPKDAKKRALVDLALEFWAQNSSKFFAVALQSFGKYEGDKPKAIETAEAAIAELDNLFLKHHKFAAGDQVSLADLPFLYYLQGQSFFSGWASDNKRLAQYFADLYAAEPELKAQVDEYQEQVKIAFAKK